VAPYKVTTYKEIARMNDYVEAEPSKGAMGNIIIHIGMHKTASTFLQTQYFKKLEGINIYAEPKFYDRLGTYPINGRFLISSEGLSGVAWNEDWKNGVQNAHHWIDSFRVAIQNLKLLYPSATIVMVVRKHGSLLLSMYKQYVQEGGILPFEKFYGKDGIIRDEDLSYQERLTVLSGNFDNVHILSFEDFKREGVSYLHGFFGSLGLSYSTSGGDLQEKNKSISGKKVDVLRAINKIYRHLPSKAKKVLQRAHVSPRQILQSWFSFWKPADPPALLEVVRDVDKKFEKDWLYAETKFWRKAEAPLKTKI
jgi:hypothetical protein